MKWEAFPADGKSCVLIDKLHDMEVKFMGLLQGFWEVHYVSFIITMIKEGLYLKTLLILQNLLEKI